MHFKNVTLIILICLSFYLPGLFTIPALDRDEARFAQASRQMVQSNDYVNIKFQDEIRAKKPIGIYWLQIASASVFGKDNIISYRAPNIFSTIILIIVFSIFVHSISFFLGGRGTVQRNQKTNRDRV